MCQGGGSSNIYSYLLSGDVSLSITMTLISSEAALGKYNRGGSRISGKRVYPGGGSNNIYSYLTGGDFSLSTTMTLIIIVAALGEYITGADPGFLERGCIQGVELATSIPTY